VEARHARACRGGVGPAPRCPQLAGWWDRQAGPVAELSA
jgi:hypothetical protein